MNVGDHELYYRCTGTGSPTVVVEAGFKIAGATSRSWNSVMVGVEQSTRICVYDRATLGMSRTSLKVRTPAEVAQDLHNLLLNGHIGRPYVLVGHSMGGWFVRAYAAAYGDEVVGMVLVDATPPDMLSRVLGALPPKSSDEAAALSNFRLNQETLWNSTSGALGERLNIAASAAQAAKVTTLGDMPLVVLSHSPTASPWGLPPDLDAKVEDAWQQSQVEQSKLSTNSSLVVATTAGHVINQDKPQLVIDAILKVVEEARKR